MRHTAALRAARAAAAAATFSGPAYNAAVRVRVPPEAVALVRRAFHDALLHPGAASHHFLGLDVSTKAIGVAIVTGRGGLVASEVLTATPDESMFSIAAAVSERVADLHAQFPLSAVGVEDFLRSFASGRSSNQSIFKLARLNGTVAYECWRRTEGRPVSLYQPNLIRSYFGLLKPDEATVEAGYLVAAATTRRKASADEVQKMAVLEFVSRVFPRLVPTWALTRTGSVSPLNFDRADAVLTAMYTAAQHYERLLLSDPVLFHSFATAVVPGIRVPGLRRARASAGRAHEEIAKEAARRDKGRKVGVREGSDSSSSEEDSDSGTDEGYDSTDPTVSVGSSAGGKGHLAALLDTICSIHNEHIARAGPVSWEGSSADEEGGAGEGNEDDDEGASAASSPRRKAARRKGASPAAPPQEDAVLMTDDAVLRVYGRVRAGFGAAVREALLWDVAGTTARSEAAAGEGSHSAEGPRFWTAKA